MRRYKILVGLLIVLDAILVFTCGYFYINKDRKAPKISFLETDVYYYEGVSQKELMKGIQATDNKDGDLSGRIVIEKIQISEDNKSAVVYYAVCDYDGNVSKASRVFNSEGDDYVKRVLGDVSEDSTNADTASSEIENGTNADIATK